MNGHALLNRSSQRWLIAAARKGEYASSVRLITKRSFASPAGDFPDSIKRVGTTEPFPNEYPGMIYAFNWCLNGDGVTPIRQSAFQIIKPFDLKVAGLKQPARIPLKIVPADASKMPEAGSDELTFEDFDAMSQKTRDWLSLAEHLYCPEGHVPGTRTAVRIITNSPTLAPDMLAYLERAPRLDPPENLPITVYMLEGDHESFAGFAVEEIEVPIYTKEMEEKLWVTNTEPKPKMEAKSVASVVVVGKTIDLSVVVAGIEMSQKMLAVDEMERETRKKQAGDA